MWWAGLRRHPYIESANTLSDNDNVISDLQTAREPLLFKFWVASPPALSSPVQVVDIISSRVFDWTISTQNKK